MPDNGLGFSARYAVGSALKSFLATSLVLKPILSLAVSLELQREGPLRKALQVGGRRGL